ncbi:MAG: hypothetical protein FWB85_02620 [Chitinispirillia bacterium]|nr:hypothetical protein [Chitinispirillia bacterium]MCL2241318.1 hypothetical protein [Chitinispirillia bacterium]
MPAHASTLTIIITLTALTLAAVPAASAPAVITGKDLPHLIGKPIASIRVLNISGEAIPFQIDEVTADGEYILDMGEKPNTADGNGLLDERDEIVFLWSDASKIPPPDSRPAGLVKLTRGTSSRAVVIKEDTSVKLSEKMYIDYNHETQRVSTPYYYASFAPNRFHFVRAGIKNFSTGKYTDLTNELRVEILLKTLFGLIPIRYTENNIVCLVRRYKTGPIRLIRRGDFHLNLGLGVKGSKAAVNQLCYPQAVKVPVYVNLPIRFRTLFGQAHIEMTPVIREAGRPFTFAVPSENLSFAVDGNPIDTLHAAVPAGRLFSLRDGAAGYGWLLNTTMAPEYLSGSGFLLRRPSSGRGGIAECGFRLTVRDVPKGSYYITNWVLFSGGKDGDIGALGRAVNLPVAVEN